MRFDDGWQDTGTPGVWRTVGTRFVVDDAWLRLRADTCIDAAGEEISPFYVTVSPDWVCVIPFVTEDELLLVEEYRHGAGAAVLGFPGGRIEDSDRDPAAAAERELLEETGFRGTAAILGTVWANAANHTNRVHMVVVTEARRVAEPDPGPGEQSRIRVMRYDEFKAEALATTSQGSHIAALPFVDRWRADRGRANPQRPATQ